MSTPDEPETPQLTRRQLRELRNTASNPIISPETSDEPLEPAAPVAAPLPRAAEPAPVSEEPPAAEDVDLDAPALTRRNARRQERIRTASVPVIDTAAPDTADEADAELAHPDDDLDATGTDTDEASAEQASADETHADAASEEETSTEDAVEAEADESDEAADALAESQTEAPDVETSTDDDAEDASEDRAGEEASDEEPDRPIVAPSFGSGLLAGEGVELELPASFDQLLTRSSPATGALPASNALILSQTPETGSFVSPVASTGEVLITGTYNLPESFGSTGAARGSSDGKDLDAMFIDGELPASSSPTPIAASAAISTIKSADDIIKPPAPEKGSRLMLALVITAGALALALTGVLIVALVTGAFR